MGAAEDRVADLLDAHICRGQLGKAEEADKVVSGEAGDVQAGLEVLQDCLHDYAKAACLQQLLQVLPQLPQQLRLHLRCRPALHLHKCMPSVSTMFETRCSRVTSSSSCGQGIFLHLQCRSDCMCAAGLCLSRGSASPSRSQPEHTEYQTCHYSVRNCLYPAVFGLSNVAPSSVGV